MIGQEKFTRIGHVKVRQTKNAVQREKDPKSKQTAGRRKRPMKITRIRQRGSVESDVCIIR